MITRRQAIMAAASLAGAAPLAHARSYPSRPIKLIYNFAPGGPGDSVARYLAQQAGDILGQSVIVENRSGGAGAVGILATAQAPADGYTILYTPVTGVVQVPLVTKDTGFDPTRSLVPILGVGSTPLAILAHPSVPADDFPSFVEWARQQPAGVDVSGAGPIIEVTVARLAQEAKLKLVYVSYRGAAPALQAVVGGEVKVYLNVPSGTTAEYLKAGKLKVIGVTSPEPSPLFPGGMPIGRHVPGFVQDINFAMWAPANVPAEARTKLADAFREVLAEPGIEARMLGQGLVVQPLGADDVSRIVRRDRDTINRILETTSVKFGG